MNSPLAPTDEERLDLRRRYERRDAGPDHALDELSALAGRICDAPIALVSFVDAERQWFTSTTGLLVRETPGGASFCRHAVLQSDLFIVPDAAEDERFADNPLVTGEPRIRFYAGAPLISPEGFEVGTLCVFDRVPRLLSAAQKEALRVLGRQVMAQLELRRRIRELADSEARRRDDVRKSERDDEALRFERDRADRYLDTAEVILLALDLEGRITLINRKGCDLLGWSEAELLGQSWVEMCLPPRIREAITLKFDKVTHGDVSVVENPILARDGTERMIQWRNRVLLDDSGRITGVFTSGSDITECDAAVEALRVAEERMRFALRYADVGIWDLDYATGMLRWSETLEAHYGVLPGTFGGDFESFVGRIHPEDRAQVLETVGKAEKCGAEFTVHNRSIWPDGSVHWLTGAGRIVLDDNGVPVRGIGISLDVTARRLLEEQFHQAQKMEAVGRLAAGVAHDFNNLLTAILLNCESLLSDRRADDPNREDLEEIQKAGTMGAALTRQLLAFSRKQVIEPTLLDVNAVVDDMRTMLERLVGKNVKIVATLRAGLSQVKADRGQVEQIVLNLAVNARDAMPRGGRLTIETANVELDADYAKTHLGAKSGPHVLLTVTDTGTGMTPEVKARLFEPFFTTKDVGRGTGLGMATVHGIVMQSGGNVEVHSEIGKGTSFKVYLPRAGAEAVTGTTPPPASRIGPGGQTVLVVEDADGLREIAKRILEKQGYKVLVAANAREALRLFERNPSIDVMLTDVKMPGKSGPELAKDLIERRPSLPVIYMSGYTEDEITQHGVLKPGIAFLNKPFTSETLGQKIRDVLDRQAAEGPRLPGAA